MTMELRSLNIRRYNLNPEQPFSGTITFHGSHGNIELEMNPRLSEKVVRACAEELALAAQEAADSMVETVMASVAKALPEPEPEPPILEEIIADSESPDQVDDPNLPDGDPEACHHGTRLTLICPQCVAEQAAKDAEDDDEIPF